ncbi:hypothetical protein VUR80DRAFT_4585 [Thermomyces stellatus]
MGKRKKSSRQPRAPKKKDPLPKKFTCLFCNHEEAVTVQLDKKGGVGVLECNVCGQNFQCAINYLSEAVDVYGEWVDAADMVAKEDERRKELDAGARSYARKSQRQGDEALAGDEDDY